jgi:branched-chain amino acid transport system permease protein
VQPQAFWIVGGMIVIVMALSLFMNHTRFGKAVIATAADSVAARLVGINTSLAVGFSFAASATIGAIAGFIATPLTLTSYDSGVLLALKGFAAAVLGGIGNPVGALVGGLLIGVLEALCAGLINSAYKDAAAFITIILMLLVRPEGLFGASQTERV